MSWDRNNSIKKQTKTNYDIQFPINSMLKYEIENKNIQLKKTRVPVTKGLPKDSVVVFFLPKNLIFNLLFYLKYLENTIDILIIPSITLNNPKICSKSQNQMEIKKTFLW